MKNKIFVLFLLGIFCLSFINAGWIIPKYTTCQFMNVTGTDCDELWCNINDYKYNSTLEVCVVENSAVDVECNMTGFYNKSEVDNLLNNSLNITIENNESWKSYVDNITIQLRDSLVDRIENETRLWKTRTSSTQTSEPNYYFFGFLAILVVGLIGFLSVSKKFISPKTQKQTSFKRQINNPSEFKGEEKPEEEKPKVEKVEKGNDESSEEGGE